MRWYNLLHPAESFSSSKEPLDVALVLSKRLQMLIAQRTGNQPPLNINAVVLQ